MYQTLLFELAELRVAACNKLPVERNFSAFIARIVKVDYLVLNFRFELRQLNLVCICNFIYGSRGGGAGRKRCGHSASHFVSIAEHFFFDIALNLETYSNCPAINANPSLSS